MRSGARSVVERALDLTSRLPAPLRGAQMRAIVSVLSERMLALLREASMNPDKIPETPAGRKTRLFLEAQGRKRVLALLREASVNPDNIPEAPAGREIRQVLEASRKRGRIEGERKGEAKGELKGKRDALLALLKARGFSVSAEQRAMVRDCADIAELDRWIVQAATASSIDEVLGKAPLSTGARAPRRRTATGARPRAARRA